VPRLAVVATLAALAVSWVAAAPVRAQPADRSSAPHDPVSQGDATGVAAAVTEGAPPFTAGTSTLEVSGAFLLESWNKNLATDRLLGGHVSIAHSWSDGWQAALEVELLRADLALGPDALFISLAGVGRWRFVRARRCDFFVEAGTGVTASTAPVPTRGTTFNYLVHGGAGLVGPFGRWWAVAAGVRVWHLSNGGTIRGNARNPDIEAIGVHVGLQIRLKG
jgi:hypothetical protein